VDLLGLEDEPELERQKGTLVLVRAFASSRGES
jgi:hypothetical protein